MPKSITKNVFGAWHIFLEKKGMLMLRFRTMYEWFMDAIYILNGYDWFDIKTTQWGILLENDYRKFFYLPVLTLFPDFPCQTTDPFIYYI